MSGDRFFWTSDGDERIEEFIKKNRPSIITDDLTPVRMFIWLQGAGRIKADPEKDQSVERSEALSKANELLKELAVRLAEIESDDTIPTRAKKGVKSKKARRDEEHEDAKAHLKKLSIDSGWTIGKWLLFVQHTDVDRVWASVAQSVAKGPLNEAGVVLSKVATSPLQASDGETPTHLICIYLDDVYDLDLVRKVLTVLLTRHGLEPSACKSDLYTLANIDSHHPTKLRSSIWRPHEVMEGGAEAIKALKDAFRVTKGKEKDLVNDSSTTNNQTSQTDGAIGGFSRDNDASSPKDRKSLEADNDDEALKPKARKPAAEKVATSEKKLKTAKSAAMMYRENNIFAGSDSD